jgi:hypothetical protein
MNYHVHVHAHPRNVCLCGLFGIYYIYVLTFIPYAKLAIYVSFLLLCCFCFEHYIVGNVCYYISSPQLI